jgi:hypothetical protein
MCKDMVIWNLDKKGEIKCKRNVEHIRESSLENFPN